MLITDIHELRFHFPGHAIDSIGPFVGVLDNSEHDFLMEKLGTPLYNALCDYYGTHYPDNIESKNTSYFNRLLLLSQRAVAYDAMSRAIGMHIISVNNAGVNIPTADDYGKVDLEAVKTFKNTCIKEAHAAINRLLQTLEEWTKLYQSISAPSVLISPPLQGESTPSVLISPPLQGEGPGVGSPPSRSPIIVGGDIDDNDLPAQPSSSSSSDSSDDSDNSDNSENSELETIVTLWQKSRYFYLSTSLLIPCATTMQTYWNIYDSREKFIQMLPDLLYIQEEIIAPAIGEDFCEAIISSGNGGAYQPDTCRTILRTIHKLRKVMAVMTEHRTLVINTDKLRRQAAHDEAVRLLQSAIEYIQNHQKEFAAVPDLYAALQKSPIYVKQKTAPADCTCQSQKFANNRSDSAMFVTPALN